MVRIVLDINLKLRYIKNKTYMELNGGTHLKGACDPPGGSPTHGSTKRFDLFPSRLTIPSLPSLGKLLKEKREPQEEGCRS